MQKIFKIKEILIPEIKDEHRTDLRTIILEDVNKLQSVIELWPVVDSKIIDEAETLTLSIELEDIPDNFVCENVTSHGDYNQYIFSKELEDNSFIIMRIIVDKNVVFDVGKSYICSIIV